MNFKQLDCVLHGSLDLEEWDTCMTVAHAELIQLGTGISPGVLARMEEWGAGEGETAIKQISPSAYLEVDFSGDVPQVSICSTDGLLQLSAPGATSLYDLEELERLHGSPMKGK